MIPRIIIVKKLKICFYSGIKEKDLAYCTTTIRDVQIFLTELFTKNSILLGHGLDGDLVSLKLVHNRIVDTSVVFPHKRGLPYKRALKTLMYEHLKIVIQEGGTTDVGHDSTEDAISCLKLMKWKTRNSTKP